MTRKSTDAITSHTHRNRSCFFFFARFKVAHREEINCGRDRRQQSQWILVTDQVKTKFIPIMFSPSISEYPYQNLFCA